MNTDKETAIKRREETIKKLDALAVDYSKKSLWNDAKHWSGSFPEKRTGAIYPWIHNIESNASSRVVKSKSNFG